MTSGTGDAGLLCPDVTRSRIEADKTNIKAVFVLNGTTMSGSRTGRTQATGLSPSTQQSGQERYRDGYRTLSTDKNTQGTTTKPGPEGEHHWSKHYPFCGGAFQSPIDIQTELLRFDPTLRPIELQNYNLSANQQLTLGNNGHSVQLSLPRGLHISSLAHRYTAAQLHFHWGTSNLAAGSEHTVNGKQFSAEMHVVHFNSDKYANVSMAADKSDGLAVLAVLIEVGEFNPHFNHFLKFINGVKYRDQRVQVPGFNIRGLLPARLDEYYRYDGSLTTPPCYPSVLWTVFRTPVPISSKQFLALATAVYSSHAQESSPVPLNGNYRKPQLPDNRVVLVSFKEGRGLHGTLTVTSPLLRKHIVQQLLVGDLADLADEGLQQLLAQLRQKPQPAPRWSDEKDPGDSNQEWRGSNAAAGGHALVPAPRKKGGQAGRQVGTTPLPEGALCYVCLEQEVSRQLGRTHSEDQLAKTLRDGLLTELNLRSYLDCKSDLAMRTIRWILRGRPTDEASELDLSLAKASLGLTKQQQGKALYPVHVPAASHRKAHSKVQALPWLQPMEWED
ncbi:uncharacterized protein ca12 [Aplochiton taeniatus]